MRIPYRRDAQRMPGMGQPIMDRGPDPASFERRVPLPLMAGNQQQNPVPGSDRPLQRAVNGIPSAIEAVAVEIEDPVGIDPASAQSTIPPAVERC